ncbi:uncharacterized protein LOC110706090 [Chenopodium quinoa]|uniref:uncharacterized protein LOC110706090 n=1 Tax=Chenopodium quinoa TaxID=63459 RepID=UPI000B782351|nr:uncharacterized protein LOC110706090 [Chenopodium quinoa]
MDDLGTKSLLEYGIPDTTTELLSSIIRPPITAHNFELKPQFIQFISNDSFAGTPHDYPVSHIDSFLEKCDTMKLNGVTNDAIRLRLFPFSLMDSAKEWLRDEGSQMMSPYMKHGGDSRDCRDNALTMNPTEAKELIEKMAANDNYHQGGQNSVKKGGKFDVDALTLLTSSVQALTSKFDKLQAGSSSSSPETC